ncbi:MAG: CDP-diacylglycerol--glycerol-3-phosphate 3-phosphatidyltransferase [bacterium]|nr:CDP-diacylglycerol--glycerol-3-phosphate 3-phosphatidyltransferase [Candidatus Sumerlaeota bacterium]
MNLANKLTLSRIAVIPLFLVFLFMENMTSDLLVITVSRWCALVVFIGAALTDYYDGKLAREKRMITNFGRLLDPLADKLLTMSAFVAFVQLRGPSGHPIFPAWAIIVILAREFLVTGLRQLAMTRGRIIQADRWGKHKTAWQLAGIITVLSLLCLHDTLTLCGINAGFIYPYVRGLFLLILAIIVMLTVISGGVYLVNNKDILVDDE